MQLRKTLKILMKRDGLTTQTLAKKTKISEGTIKSWLGGAAPRTLDDVRTLAHFFEVSFEYLVFGDELSQIKKTSWEREGHVFEGWLRVRIEPMFNTESEIE